MRILLTTLLLIFSSVRAEAAELDDATGLLSRYPQGRVPTSLAVVDALATLSASGTEEHIGLLDSLIQDESVDIRLLSEAAMTSIVSRERRNLRASFTPPTDPEVMKFAQHVQRPGRELGVHERKAIAYATLTLGELPSHQSENWRDVAPAREELNDSRGALRSCVLAAAMGQPEAYAAIQSFGVDAEKLLLGVWTAWCPDQQDTSHTLEVLVGLGSIHTVRVLANRAVRSRAYHRAMALDALSRMIADGSLSRTARVAAQTGLESGTRDPHNDVRELARAALDELQGSPER